LRAEDGQLKGLISFDLPRDGRRPDAAQQQVLNVHAAQAEMAVVSLVERDEFARDLEVARRFERYRGQLIDKLAHEVRNPATSILMHAELAQDEPSDSERDKHLAAITRGAHRISDMAESLLLMASVDNAGTPPSGEVHLVDVARGVHEQEIDGATDGDIDVVLDLPDRPVVVTGERDELHEAVRNLVSNAVKYSRPGGVVRLAVEDGDDHAVVCVHDEGIGISEEDRARLFEEFYRAASPEVRSKPGHGLGLAIVDRIVRRHSGQVQVDSTLGRGPTMSITLPRTHRAAGHGSVVK
jgi:signal transduction histidine kinase